MQQNEQIMSNIAEHRLEMVQKAMNSRITYLKMQAEIHGLPLEDSWDEHRIREEFRKYGIP